MSADGRSTVETLTAEVVAHHDALPPQLRKVARFVIDQPQRVALMTIADLAAAAEVQPSAVIRFAKALGYQGFSDVQRLLRDGLTDLIPASYPTRLRTSGEVEGSSLVRMAGLAQASLDGLPSDAVVAEAADRLAAARLIHVVGMRRAFGIASYLSYTLGQFGAAVNQMTGTGAMVDVAASSISEADVMVAISFPDYRPETLDMAARAVDRGCAVVAITDSPVSPLARMAEVVLLTDRGTEGGFRSIAGSVVVAQALALEYGHRRRD